MARERTVVLKVLGDGSSAGRMLRGLDNSTSSFGRTVSHVGVLARRAAYVGFGALATGIGFAIKEATEATAVTAKTRAVIKSTGGVAGVTAKHVGKLSTSIRDYSGVSDESIASAQNVLLTFKDVRNEVGEGNKIFDEATKRIVDMSVALGKDLQSSTIMVGKALNDPIAGISAMARAGVQFTDQQKEQIEVLVESGRKLEAQKIILGELQSQFGGTAKAVGDKEPWKILWGQLGDVAEVLGKELLPFARDFSKWAIARLPAAVEGVKDFAKGAINWFGQAKDAIGDFFAGVDEWLGGTGDGDAITGFAKSFANDLKVNLGAAIETLKIFWKAWQRMWGYISGLATEVGGIVSGVITHLQDDLELIIDGLTNLGGLFTNDLDSMIQSVANQNLAQQNRDARDNAPSPSVGPVGPQTASTDGGKGGVVPGAIRVINLNVDGRRINRWQERDAVLLGNR